MSGPRRQFLSILLTLIIALIAGAGGSSAQTAYIARLSSPDTTNFPSLTTYLDIHDPVGEFVHGLTSQDVTLFENGSQLAVNKMEEQEPGVQFVIAITPGASFTIRDSQGISRYDTFLQGLLAGGWVKERSGVDDFSLLTMDGPQVTHTSNPGSLLSSLEVYQPKDTNAVPSLEVLSAALQVASDPTSRPEMERAILFITPPQESDVSLGLQSIISSASQQNIRIYVWLIASPDAFDSPGSEQLRNLADQTHGAFFAFSHDETVPDLDTLLEPLRYTYQLEYNSQITKAGTQEVSARVMIGSETITSPDQSFELDLQPPMPTLLNPPNEIDRKYGNQETAVPATGNGDLLPANQVFTIKVDFQDGHERPITLTSLYVDGSIASQNTKPPFNQFTWDLRPYQQSGLHTLMVEVTDSLGLVGMTGEIPIKIIVPPAAQGVIIAISQKRPLLIGAGAIVFASILALVLILGGRIRPKRHPGQVARAAGASEKTRPAGYYQRLRQMKEPGSRPAKLEASPAAQVKRRSINWKRYIPWLKPGVAQAPALAYLIPLIASDEPTLPAPIQITVEESTIGSDPLRSNLVITDPSIDAVHARIRKNGKSFIITDEGSGAGTWVNYVEITELGTYLEHMDIIHLGKIGFRFKLSEPGQLREITVNPLETKQ